MLYYLMSNVHLHIHSLQGRFMLCILYTFNAILQRYTWECLVPVCRGDEAFLFANTAERDVTWDVGSPKAAACKYRRYTNGSAPKCSKPRSQTRVAGSNPKTLQEQQKGNERHCKMRGWKSQTVQLLCKMLAYNTKNEFEQNNPKTEKNYFTSSDPHRDIILYHIMTYLSQILTFFVLKSGEDEKEREDNSDEI